MTIELQAISPNKASKIQVRDQLISTKLRTPISRSERVPRPTLTARLEEQVRNKLTLLCAPAGFGKTSLLSEWAAQSSLPTTWFNLETHDNQIERFWIYAIAALQSIHQNLGQPALTMLLDRNFTNIEMVLTSLINDIALMPEPIALILDNYHVIHEPAIHTTISFLLDHLPPQLHLLIGSRAIPSLPLARLRGLGQVLELYANDLRFSFHEIERLFNHIHDFRLSHEQLSRLEDQSEGWITGLQLFALTLPKSNLHDSVTIQGSHRHISDYFAEEVFESLSAELRSFLLATSILNEFNARLCDAVRDGHDSLSLLDTLERENLFIVPLDETRENYRYHRLFAEFLRSRIPLNDGEFVNELHSRAAEWYIDHAQMSEAINHSLAAQTFEQAARLAEQNAEAIWMNGQIIVLRDWLEALPEELLRSRPRLCLFHAWALFFTEHELYAAETRVQDAEKCLSAPTTSMPDAEVQEIRGMITTLLAAFSVRYENVDEAVERSQKALEELPNNNLHWRSAATLSLGVAYAAAGDVDAADRTLAESGRLSQISGHQLNDVITAYNQGRTKIQQGSLQQAAILFRQAVGLAEQYNLQLPVAGTARIGLGHLLYEWNNLNTASNSLLEGIALCEGLGNVEAPVKAHICLAHIKRVQHDSDGAIEHLQIAEQMARRANQILFIDWVNGYQARLQLMQGNLEAASRWAKRRNIGLETSVSHLKESEYFNLARVWIAVGNIEQAQMILAPLLRSAETMGRGKSVIEALILQALAKDSLADTDSAIALLKRALMLAEPGGFIRLFADEGKAMSLLLRHAASRGIAPQYVSQLLTAFEDSAHAIFATSQPLIDPLSERELEVLHLITQGLSNHQIANELYVAISTVKTHVKSIYRKLNVSNRFEAIERVRDLSLLSNDSGLTIPHKL